MYPAPPTLEETIDRMGCLPVAFRLRSPVSLITLADQTGYDYHRDSLDIACLRNAIHGRTGLIDAWLLYSREKTEEWGWFMEAADRGSFLVGPRRYSIEGPQLIADPAEACAHFIKREFECLLPRRLACVTR